MRISLQPNELVMKAGNTSYINGKDVKGKLIATNQRIYFEAFDKDEKTYNRIIELENIQEIMPFYSLAIIPNGLNIITKKGDELKFKVKKRKTWELLINKMY